MTNFLIDLGEGAVRRAVCVTMLSSKVEARASLV